MSASDVVVVGAGAIGAGCAWELAGAGLSVTLVERAAPGAGASGASAGILSASGAGRSDPLAALGRLSREMYEPMALALAEEAGIDIGLGRTGHLDLCMTEEEVLWARQVAADPLGAAEGVTFVPADDLRRLEPAITPAALGALHLSRGSWVDSVGLVRALVLAAERRGVRLVLGRGVEALVGGGGRVTGVRVEGLGVLPAGAVVLAAGAWCGGIAGAPDGLALRPVKGQILALGNAPPAVRHVVFRGDVYLVPRVSGECLVGATVEEGRDDRRVTLEGLRWLLEGALLSVPGLRGRPFLRAWAGVRPATRDGLPAVGPWPDTAGLHVAAGHHRNGILLMPATARIIREWIVDGRTTIPGDALLPGRLLRPVGSSGRG